MAGLDSRLALALMAKAELVFGQAGQVLAFPVGSASYRARDLNFLPEAVDAEGSRIALKGLSDFSRLANLLPQGRLWLSVAGRADLAQVYRRVLEQAQVAALPESAADRAQLETAKAVLMTVAADGSTQDTPVYVAYKQQRDAYLQAQQQYNAAKISGELGGSAESAQRWAAQEPILHAACEQARLDWELQGHRAQVEAAQATVVELSRKAPLTTWSEWDARSQRGVGTMNDLTGTAFWPCYISPANACEVGWQHMVLTGKEVKALQDNAPAELKARYGAQASALDVVELEFEFTSAKLQRPWFDGELFRARFWRAPADTAMQLSKGREPFVGDCPLYASAVVFFRRIVTTVEAKATEVMAKLSIPDEADAPFALRWAELKEYQLPPPMVQHPVVADPGPDIFEHQVPVHGEGLGVGPGFGHAGSPGLGLLGGGMHGAAQGQVTHLLKDHGLASQLGDATTLHHLGQGPLVYRLDANLPAEDVQQGLLIRDVAEPEPLPKFSEDLLVSKRLVMREKPPASAVTAASMVAPQRGTTRLETAADEIYVLAFICTVVPASPNPDPALTWE